jgi:hypothetical protein
MQAGSRRLKKSKARTAIAASHTNPANSIGKAPMSALDQKRTSQQFT